MDFQRFFNDPGDRDGSPPGEGLVGLLLLQHRKQEQFQEAADNLACLETDVNDYQRRVENAISAHMGLHELVTLVVHSPHLPVEEVWLCRLVPEHGPLTMTRVSQIQACAIMEVPF